MSTDSGAAEGGKAEGGAAEGGAAERGAAEVGGEAVASTLRSGTSPAQPLFSLSGKDKQYTDK